MKFKPSKAHRWVGGGCTASVKLEAEAIPRPAGDAAAEGTRLHGVAEGLLKGELERDDVSDDDYASVGPYVNDVVDPKQWGDGTYGVETRLQGTGMRGIADATRSTADKLIVWDLKTGMRPVEVEDNWQLLIYAMMMGHANRVVELRIVQSTAYHPDGPVRKWIVPDIRSQIEIIQESMRQARDAPVMRATPNNCTYCAAVTSCPAARSVTLGGADLALKETSGLPADVIRSELVTLRNTHKMLTTRKDALEAEVEQRMKNGEHIPGCSMESGRAGNLAWTAKPGRIAAMCDLVGVEAHVEPKLKTPTQLIKAGMSAEMMDTLAKRGPGKMTVSTETRAETAKAFKNV